MFEFRSSNPSGAHKSRICRIALGLFTAVTLVAAAEQSGKVLPAAAPVPPVPSAASYVVGAGDEITVSVLEIEELNRRQVRIENNGTISLPLVGRIRAAGLTVPELEVEIRKELQRQIIDPQVSVSMTEFRSQPVSVMGAVNRPGVLQVQGRKSLAEVISMAEGLRTDASHTVTITRRLQNGRLPVPGATDDPSGEFSVASIDLKNLIDGRAPQDNIEIKPNDIVSVPHAPMVYVFGEVNKSGSFALTQGEGISVLEAVSMAAGFTRTAATKNARILRAGSDRLHREEVAVDLSKLLSGKANDVFLHPGDILFVPNSATKRAAMRALEAAVQLGTGVLIYH